MNMHKVTYEDEKLKADIQVSEETVLHGMRRTRLKVEATIRNEEDPDRSFLSLIIYPDLMSVSSGTVKFKGKSEVLQISNLGFEEFLTLPGKLDAVWEKAVYEINPHFLPPTNEDEEQEEEKKRQPISTSDLSE